MEDHVQPIGLVFITMREGFHCNLKEVRVLLNALSVVKSFYFYMTFSRLIANQKKGKKNKRLLHSHFRKYSPLHFTKKAGAALVRTITSQYT